MIFITGPLYSGKRTFAQNFPGTRITDVQELAAAAEDLESLADRLAAYDLVLATEVGGDAGKDIIDGVENGVDDATGNNNNGNTTDNSAR